MDNEIRFIHREETFDDLAVRELAKGRAACLCKVQFGRCKKSECATCSVNKQYITCYNQLTDYNKQRLQTYVSKDYVEYSLNPQAWMSYNKLVLNTIKWIVITVLSLLMLLVPLCKLSAEPRTGIDRDWRIQDAELERKVTAINKYIDTHKYDMNKDGKVDDKDCSAMFKKRWNDLYPSESTKCRIARIDKNGFMYFFVIVHGYGVDTTVGDTVYCLVHSFFIGRYSFNDVVDNISNIKVYYDCFLDIRKYYLVDEWVNADWTKYGGEEVWLRQK